MEYNGKLFEQGVVVSISDLSEKERTDLFQLRYHMLELYPKLHDMAHHFSDVLMLGDVRIFSLPEHTAEQTDSMVRDNIQKVQNILYRIEKGASPKPFDPRLNYSSPLSPLVKGANNHGKWLDKPVRFKAAKS